MTDAGRCVTSDCWVETHQGRLFARCWQPRGDHGRTPIVLFHDSLGCVELWRGFPAVLAEETGRRVIAYDRLGFGRSEPHQGALSLDFIGDEAQRFFPVVRESLAFDRFIALGHSVGGGMATHCAALHAGICEALITESAQSFVEDKTRAGVLAAKKQFEQPETFERLRRYHGDKSRWVLDAWIETWLSPEFSDWTLKDVLPRVRCPTLAIHGSDDEYGSTRQAETIAGLVGGPSQLEILPGARHVPHREQEAWLAKRIAGFLAATVSAL